MATAATITGNGTQTSPYRISDESSFRQFAANVNNGNSYSGKYFLVTADIALSGEWTPVGTASIPFHGNFDGNGKTISGMTVSGDYSGLFAYIGSGATIKNVHLTDVSAEGATYVSGLVAHADSGTGSITISGCSVSGTVSDVHDGNLYDGYLGGVVAYANAKKGSITISDCATYGTINCDSYSGGVVGCGEGINHSLKLTNCVNKAYINAGSNANACGGIGGKLSGAELTACINFANVLGNAYSEDNGSSWLGGISGEGWRKHLQRLC